MFCLLHAGAAFAASLFSLVRALWSPQIEKILRNAAVRSQFYKNQHSDKCYDSIGCVPTENQLEVIVIDNETEAAVKVALQRARFTAVIRWLQVCD